MNNASTAPLRKKIVVFALVVLLLGGLYALMHSSHTTTSTKANSANKAKEPAQQNTNVQGFNRSAHSLTAAGSLWVIVNKQHPLNPKTYTPSLTVPPVALKGSRSASNMHVSSAMAPALAALFKAAQSAGYPLMLSSGYRSYSYQVSVYGTIVRSKGQSQADQESARPGYSEHQTGLAADVAPTSGHCDLSQCFGSTPQGQWLAAHAYAYGFIIRYPAGKESVTGYEYEPWHIRYVGINLATEMHQRGVSTLEEFFQVSGGTSYN